MSKLTLALLAAACLTLASGSALAQGKASAGQAKSEDCADCHGEDGAGDGDTIPAIAAMPVAKFVKAMNEYKDGTRTGSKMMTKSSKKLSDQDIADLAAYYATLKP